jgi:hypothetical protein
MLEMKTKVLQSEIDAIMTNEKIMSRLQQEKSHLERLIQENRLLADRISTIDHEYCSRTGSAVHRATYSKGILTHQYLKGKKVFRVKVGALIPRGGFSKAYVVDIPLEILMP